MSNNSFWGVLVDSVVSRLVDKLAEASSDALNHALDEPSSAAPTTAPSPAAPSAPLPPAEAPHSPSSPVSSAPAWLELVRPMVHHFEQCRLIAYWDAPGQVWTCGWGSTGPDVCESTVWIQDEADARCDADLSEAARHVDDAVHVALTPHQKAALVSLVYNVGPGRASYRERRGRDGIVRLASGQPSTLLRKLNAGDYAGAADQFLVWNRAGGQVLRGLVKRRTAERNLFVDGVWQ